MLLFLRIYAVIYLVLFIEGLAFAATNPGHRSMIGLIDMVFFAPVAVIGLWSAGYRHISLPKHGWKILLFASVFWRPIAVGNAVLTGDAIPKFRTFVSGLTANMQSDSALAVTLLCTAGVCLLGSLLILPPLIALYRNAFGDESLLKLMSPNYGRAPDPARRQAALAELAARRAAEANAPQV